MLGTLVRALVREILEERELYAGDGIVTGNAHTERIERLVAELDKITLPTWETLRDAAENDRPFPGEG